MKRRDVWHFLSYSDPSLSHEKHVSCQGLLRHLVKQRLVVDRAQLGELLRKPLLIPFGGLLVLLLLLFWKFLPFLRYHPYHFCNFYSRVLLWDYGSLFVAEQNVRWLRFLDRNIFLSVKGRSNLRKISEVYCNSTVRVQHWAKAVLRVRTFFAFREVVTGEISAVGACFSC